MPATRCRPSRQQSFAFRTHGGKRRGAGRKPKGARPGVSDRTRPKLSRHLPVHTTWRVCDDVPRLRRFKLFKVVQEVLFACNQRWQRRFRVVRYSLQRNHFHYLVEARDQTCLSRGMQSLHMVTSKR